MVTSYYAMCKYLDVLKIPHVAISIFPPKWYRGPVFKTLAPTKEILIAAKDDIINDEEYILLFQDEILNKLDPHQVYNNLISLYGPDIALLCFEKPGDFCHRHIVALWFENHLNINVPEWKLPNEKTRIITLP